MFNKRRLFIIGASSFARELESWLNLIPETEREWELMGFFEKDITKLDGAPSNLSIVGDESVFQFESTDMVVLGIAEPDIKRRVYEELKSKVDFFTYIAPNAIIGEHNIIEEGVVICPNTVITTNVKISKCTTINIGCNIGHDVEINSYSSIMPNVDLGGFVKVGEGAFLGTKTTVIPSKKIGDNSFVGAGSVVIRNVKNGDKVVGNPARKL